MKFRISAFHFVNDQDLKKIVKKLDVMIEPFKKLPAYKTLANTFDVNNPYRNGFYRLNIATHDEQIAPINGQIMNNVIRQANTQSRATSTMTKLRVCSSTTILNHIPFVVF